VNYQYNPYAAPQAAPPMAPGVIQPGSPQPWSVGEVITIAWERFKANWAVVVFSYVLMMVIVEAIAMVPTVALLAGAVDPASGAYTGLTVTFWILQFVAGAYFQAGLTKIWIETARGATPSFGTLFAGADRFLSFLACYVLFALGVFFGSIFFIVPGVILGLGLVFGTWYTVDARMGPIDALVASWNATKGHKGDLFVLFLAAVGLWILGALMCIFGMFVTVPLSYIALGVAYTRISGLGSAPGVVDALPQGGYPGSGPGYPPAGYGGPQGAPPGYGPPGTPPGYGPPPGFGGPPGPPPGYGPPR
jgi:uncharacterized membrane protein